MIWSARIDWPLTSDNLIKTNSLRGNPEFRFKIRDFGQNVQSTPYHKKNQMADKFNRANEKRSVDFWSDMLANDIDLFSRSTRL